jgi:hypothetical protein
MGVWLTTGCVCDGEGLTGVLNQHQLQQGTREAVKCGKVQPVRLARERWALCVCSLHHLMWPVSVCPWCAVIDSDIHSYKYTACGVDKGS